MLEKDAMSSNYAKNKIKLNKEEIERKRLNQMEITKDKSK